MPFKANADRRHRIPKQRRRITNWAEYDAALRQRGSLTVWFTEAAIAAWHAEPRTTPGGQPHYSSLAIATGLTLKAVFRLALRQTEGLIGSIIRLLGLDQGFNPVSDLKSLQTASNCCAMISCDNSTTPETPVVFCAVIAVITDVPKTPRAAKVFKSA